MTQYYEMKKCFAVCGDNDAPFNNENGGYNNSPTRKKSKSELIEGLNSWDNAASLLFALSDKWQIQRMYLCEGCGKYFKSEDCESISGSGTFNCDECNHPEPKPMTAGAVVNQVADEMPPKRWEVFYVKDVADKCYKNGSLAEYQRPEQNRLRDACDKINFEGSVDMVKFSEYLQEIREALKALKPPTQHTGVR